MAEQSQYTGALGGAGRGAAAGSAFGPIGIGIGALAGGIGGFLSGGGEDEAQQLAEDQARLIEQTAAENRRRSVLQMNTALGYTKAAIYASNIQNTGSSKKYYGAMESQFRKDMAWDTQKARIDAQLVRDGGSAVADRIKSSGVVSAIGGFSEAAGSGAFGTYTSKGGYKSPFA
jgi:hypothetical protein